MSIAFSRPCVDNAVQVRVFVVVFGLIALATGAIVANASSQALLMVALVLLASVVAATAPITALPLFLAALVPVQLYFFIAGTNYAVHVAVFFLAVAGLRLLLVSGIRASLRGLIWIIPVAFFFLAAFLAAFTALDRFSAFKGIYEWLPIVACIFISSLTVQSTRIFDRLILILVVGGTLQAILGLVEYAAGLDRALTLLASPLSGLFFQPNLLQERLTDLSFNWILSGRALPFGTFINEIDYAIFLAAIILLAIAQAFSQPDRTRIALALSCAFVMSVALLLTLKASGFVALVGGAMVLLIYFARRLSLRMLYLAPAIFVISILLIAPLSDSIFQRATFLVEREQNEFREIGRLRIWLGLFSSFEKRPLFGYGLNNSELLSEPTRTLHSGAFAFNPTSPESAYVETLVETGAVGFIALMSLFAMTLARAHSRARHDVHAIGYAGVIAALLAIWLGNISVSALTTVQNGMLMGILIGLVFAEWKTA